MKKIYYIQKEEIQLRETTVFTPTFYEDYDIAKADFKGLIKMEKDEISYIEDEVEGVDFVGLKGSDEWGKVNKRISLRSNDLNKKLIYTKSINL